MRSLIAYLAATLTASLLAVASNGVFVATSAQGAAGEPLEITQFTIAPTSATVEKIIEGPFGLENEFVNEPYTPPLSQAGSHPWGLTTVLEFANRLLSSVNLSPTEEVKDVVIGLPPGLIGNPMAVPRCSLSDAFARGSCPSDTQVGVYRVEWLGGKELLAPIVDVVPVHGQSAEFALLNEFKISAGLIGHLVRIPAKEGKPASYGLTVSSNGIPTVQLVRIETTFWGVPADPSHDVMRGLICNRTGLEKPFTCDEQEGGERSGVAPVPFLTLGADCAAGPEIATVRADSWEEPGHAAEGRYEGYVEASAPVAAPTGCDLLSFHPEIESQPDTLLADEPVGMNVNVRVPLNEAAEGLATPQLRNAVVTLPQGVTVNPSIVDGVRACEATGLEGINIDGPLSEEPGPSGELQLAPGRCPDASIVGTAEAVTPLLPTPVKGHVFLARPGCGVQPACTPEDAADGNLYRLYLELGGTGELADTGVHIKVEGRTRADLATGQLTTSFLENPQTPFSELKVHLNGGPRAPLANPATCGNAVTSADFTPWSAPGETPEGLFVAGVPDAAPFSFYEVEGCSASQPFAPKLLAGSVTPQGGQFTSFTFDLTRQDREQDVRGVRLHTPPGLLAMLSSVPLCQEPQADAGDCGTASQIGTTRVASGAGSHPFEIEGAVYLTGPYRGAPFGLSVVTHAVAGPFDLGLVVVRGRIDIDRTDSTATITFDEAGPHAIPQMLFGVPLRLQRITANVDRPKFMLNPTNCGGEQQLIATISGSAGGVRTIAVSFALAGCKALAFAPRFEAFTNGHTSRAKGASLDTRLSYPANAVGADANIARVKVDLPRSLPSKLVTLQHACPAQVFDANPSSCPAASIVGIARTTTPLLAGELSGPAFFVSHGGEAFPSLVIVLEGDGIRVDLTGATSIRKGITSSTFKTVPDVPVRTFELYLPQGRLSALAANGNLCKARGRLRMPTEFVAQNGLVIHRSTKIAVTGCRKAKTTAARPKGRRSKSARGAVRAQGRNGR